MNTGILKEGIKLWYADPKWVIKKRKIQNEKGKRFFIIGGPVHGNLGDHAIIEAEKKFVKEFFPDYKCIEILMPFYLTHKKFLECNINTSDIVSISGGGWMGNLWIHNEIVIREIVNTYLENLVLIFPQTVYYTNDSEGMKELQITKQIFSKHRNLIFCLRDKNSYDLVKDNFNFQGKSKAALYPDMVLFDFPTHFREERKKIINVCMRNDCEAINADISNMLKASVPAGYEIRNISTVLNKHVSLKQRNQKLKSSWHTFAEAKLTITDRLHAMLFSYINGTPCLALNNKTGKVFGVYEWLKNQNTIVCIKSVEDIPLHVKRMLTLVPDEPDGNLLRSKFFTLANEIKGHESNYEY